MSWYDVLMEPNPNMTVSSRSVTLTFDPRTALKVLHFDSGALDEVHHVTVG